MHCCTACPLAVALTHASPSLAQPPSDSIPRNAHEPSIFPGYDADALSLSIPGPSRCFPFWQEVLACYVTNSNVDSPNAKGKCLAPLDDYYECLHHKKEVRAPSIYTHTHSYTLPTRRTEQGGGESWPLAVSDTRVCDVTEGLTTWF